MKIERPISKQPIPKNAKLVFKGVLFEVWQWKQKMFDGTEAIFEKLKRPDTVVVFPILPDGRVVLIEQEQPGKRPFIGGAGGRVDEGENILDATKRELLEETGFQAENFILWNAQHPTSKIDWAVYTFLAKGVRKIKEPELDSGERITLKLVTFDEFLEIGLTESFAEKEIVFRLMEARLLPEKEQELRKLFSPE